MQNQNVSTTIFPFFEQNVLTDEECASLIEVCDAQGQPGMIKADGGKKKRSVTQFAALQLSGWWMKSGAGCTSAWYKLPVQPIRLTTMTWTMP